ncbi:MAG: formate/nitrite transporter family protein [Actinomycetes bacterium]
MANGIGSTFSTSVDEGTYRLNRTTPSLLATGFVGGLDVSVGVLAALLVLQGTGSSLLSALGFSIGFIALTLANSELFTENFLLPIAAVVARKARMRAVWRLWAGTAVTNLLGGLLMVSLIMLAFPELGATGVEKGALYLERGLSWSGFASAVLAGIVITLMTWMQQGTQSTGARIVAAVAAAFLLSYGHLSHVVVASLEVFAGMFGGAGTPVGEWAALAVMWALGNAVGGIGLVTMLRIVQVGPRRLRAEQERQIAETDESMVDLSDDERAAAERAERAEDAGAAEPNEAV